MKGSLQEQSTAVIDSGCGSLAFLHCLLAKPRYLQHMYVFVYKSACRHPQMSAYSELLAGSILVTEHCRGSSVSLPAYRCKLFTI
jgi:hypothetical protein